MSRVVSLVCVLSACVVWPALSLAQRGVPRMSLPEAPQERQQVEEPLFTVEVTRVEVSVLVLDSEGKPVVGLSADDFEVREEGVPQQVRSFTAFTHTPDRLVLPDPMLPPAPGETTLTTVTPPASNYYASESRVFALILDDLHVDVRRTAVARAAARRLVAQLEPTDLLFVVTTSSTESTGYFTRDRAHATRMIDAFQGRRLLDKTMQSKRYRDDNSEPERLDHYQRLCATLRNVSLALRELSGRRKTVVLLSEGSSYGAGMSDMEVRMPSAQSSDRVNAGSGSLRLMNDVLAAAAAGNVAIYPLNPNGLDVPDADLIQVSGLQGGLTPEAYSAILMEARQSREMARDLAILTGGVSLVDTNDSLGGIDRVMRDASTHYVLTYEPDTPIKGSEYRRIDVEVKRPGVRVLARRGYRAAGVRPAPPLEVPGSLSPHLRRLLAGIVPDDGLPMRVETVPVARAGRRTTMAVILEIDGARLADRPLEGTLDIDHGLLTVNESGKADNGVRRAFTLRPSEAQWAVLAESGLRSVWAVDLPPGRHQVRVAAIDARSGRGGSVYLDIVVPKPPAWPAGALVASRFLAMIPTPFIDPRLTPWTDIAPTTSRVFPRGDVLAVTIPHDSAKGSTHARLVLADGRTAWEGAGLPLDGTSSVRFVVPLTGVEGISTLAITTSNGIQHLPVSVIAPPPETEVR